MRREVLDEIEEIRKLKREVHTLKSQMQAGIARKFIDWTPTFSNITEGTGATRTSEYTMVGDLVFCRYVLTVGSTFDIQTNHLITLPVEADRIESEVIGTGRLNNADGVDYAAFVVLSTSTQFRIFQDGAGALTTLSNTSPFAWTTGDGIWVQFWYKSAA